jgi:hypothetical protein
MTSRERILASAIVILSTLITALSIEGGLRLYGPEKLGLSVYSSLNGRPYPAAPSDYLPMTTTPYMVSKDKTWEYDVTYTFNSLGYRGPFPKHIEKGDARRVLLLGDSFTLGWGVNFPKTFAGRLQERFGSSVEIIDAAYHNGYSPDAYYAYLLKEGLALKPDVIILMLCHNDIEDLRSTIWIETDQNNGPTRLTRIMHHATFFFARQAN